MLPFLSDALQILGLSAPLLVPCVIVFEQWLVQKLPHTVADRLVPIADMAASMAEQKLAGSSGPDKMAAALVSMQGLCKRAGLPYDPTLAQDLIELAVFGFNQYKKPASPAGQAVPVPVQLAS